MILGKKMHEQSEEFNKELEAIKNKNKQQKNPKQKSWNEKIQ